MRRVPKTYGPRYIIAAKAVKPMSAQEAALTVDLRSVPLHQRRGRISKTFETLKPGQAFVVVNEDEPKQLFQFMAHESKDFDEAAYSAHERRPGEWVGIFRKKTTQDLNAPKVVFTSFAKERVLDANEFSTALLCSNSRYRVTLLYFSAGQSIPVHSPANDLVLLVYSGRGEVVAGNYKFEIKSGDIVQIPGGTCRGIRALTEMEVLHFVSPPPSDSDRDEVVKKLEQGRFE